MKRVKPYHEIHQQGFLSLEHLDIVPTLPRDCDLGIMIAEDGWVWICVDGLAFLRFSPHPDRKMQKWEGGISKHMLERSKLE